MEEERSSSSLSTSASESSESSWTGNNTNPQTPSPNGLDDGVTLRRKSEAKTDSDSGTVKPRVMSLNFLPKPYSKPTGDPISPIVFKSFQAPETGRGREAKSCTMSSPKPPIAPKPKLLRGKTTDF